MTDFYILLSLCVLGVVHARRWHDTGGSILLEEAWTAQEILFQSAGLAPPVGGTLEDLQMALLDVHGERIDRMDASGVDFMVLSCSTPCVQGFSVPEEAEKLATRLNDQLAAAISNNTMRFGAFAALSMHNATQASQELTRAVKELSFLGALLNDYQQSGADNATLLYFDQPEYDVFWKTVQDLDVPVYMHPRVNIAQLNKQEYQHAIWLNGSPQGYAATLSTHVLGLCANGIFDRFPKVRVIVGHSGERIPSDLIRIDEQLQRQHAKGLPMNRTITSYWKTNLFETTSANFATELLLFHINQIGLDRIMYSVDYPFAMLEEGAAWVKTLPLSKKALRQFTRDQAIELLGLNK